MEKSGRQRPVTLWAEKARCTDVVRLLQRSPNKRSGSCGRRHIIVRPMVIRSVSLVMKVPQGIKMTMAREGLVWSSQWHETEVWNSV